MLDIEVLISGAGIVRDQSCLTKTKDSFEAVLRTKVMPLCVLLARLAFFSELGSLFVDSFKIWKPWPN